MKRIRLALCILTVLAVPGLGLSPRLNAEELSGSDLYKKCVKSCVFIVNITKQGQSSGSGSLIDADKRLVLTNYHVVKDEEKVYVQFPVYNKDGTMMTDKKKYIERIPAGQAIIGKVLYRDKSRDLSIVQLERIPPGTPALPLARDSVEVGETVFNIGSPGAVEFVFSTTDGRVRAVGVMDFVIPGSVVLRIKCKMVTATNPVNRGDSGGPLINSKGRQIAVTQSGIFSEDVQNVNHFVDVTEVRAFLNEKKIIIKEQDEKPADYGPKGPAIKKKGSGTSPLDNDPSPGNGGTTPPAKGPMPPEKVTPPGKGTTPVDPPADAPSPATEKEAQMALNRANVFKEGDDNRPTYIAKLNDLIKKYPGTQAAKEAKKILDGLK
jgi:S1-C subfamily serine protease